MEFYLSEKMYWWLVRNNERTKALDLWRAIAIILVLFRHAPIGSDSHYLIQLLQKGGWVGVDIFFVLSGFLVSGLLLKEYKTKKHIDIKRFLIRRGFKIYPSFYLFSLFYIGFNFFFKERVFSSNQLFGELFFIQNYLGHIHPHTWTLAVEEHFYLLLPFFILFFIKRDFGFILITFIVIINLTRIFTVFYFGNNESFHYMSHLRIDSLFIGVYLQYLHQFKADLLNNILENKWLTMISIVAIPIPFLIDINHIIMPTLGYTLIYLSYAFQIGKSLRLNLLKNHNYFLKTSTLIGLSSYNIYLWHFQPRNIIERLTHLSNLNHYLNDITIIILYIFSSSLLGILITLTFENYFLNLRERFSFSKKN